MGRWRTLPVGSNAWLAAVWAVAAAACTYDYDRFAAGSSSQGGASGRGGAEAAQPADVSGGPSAAAGEFGVHEGGSSAARGGATALGGGGSSHAEDASAADPAGGGGSPHAEDASAADPAGGGGSPHADDASAADPAGGGGSPHAEDASGEDAAVAIGSGGAQDAAASGFDCQAVAGILADGRCYFAGDQRTVWESTLCENWGAHLITITSAEEQTIAASILPGTDRWIGLYRPEDTAKAESSYVWVTEEPLAFTRWHAYGGRDREPNHTGPCVRLRTEGGWGDDDCTQAHAYLCEHE